MVLIQPSQSASHGIDKIKRQAQKWHLLGLLILELSSFWSIGWIFVNCDGID